MGQASLSKRIARQNRRATDPYGRWCGAGVSDGSRYPIRIRISSERNELEKTSFL